MFFPTLSKFYPDFILMLFRFFRNSLYPDFFQTLFWFYLDKIWMTFYSYCTRAIIRFVYFFPNFWSSFMYCDLWPYVWLIIESGFKSRAAYDGARTVFKVIKIWFQNFKGERRHALHFHFWKKTLFKISCEKCQ